MFKYLIFLLCLTYNVANATTTWGPNNAPPFNVITISNGSTYTVQSLNALNTNIFWNSSSGSAKSLALKGCSAADKGNTVIISDVYGDAGTNNITITPSSGTINSTTSNAITTNYGFVRLTCNGTSDWIASAGIGGETSEDARNNLLHIPSSCDGVHGASINTTSGSKAITANKDIFEQKYVGKAISLQAAGAASATLVTTIESVQGPRNATLTVAPSATLTSVPFAFGSDYSNEIQAAINAGIPIHLPKGECGIARTLNITDNTTIIGYGSSAFFPPQSSLMWLSASADPMLNVSDATTVLVRANVKGLTLWGMCAASIGADIKGLQVSTWDGVQPINMLTSGFNMDTSADTTKDTGENTFIRLQPAAQSACADSMVGLVAQPGIVAPGAHELTRNTFIDFRATMRAGTGLDLYGINSSDFYNTRLYTSTTGKAMVLHHAISGVPQHAHANWFFGLEAQGQVVSENGGAQAAANNYILGWDVSTFSQNVDVQSGSTLYCRTTGSLASTGGGGNPNGCSAWAYYGLALKLDNSSASATIFGNSSDNGIRLSGGANDGNGGKVTLFGTTASVPSSIYLDGDTITLRDALQSANTFIVRPNKGHISVGNTTAPALTGCGNAATIVGTDIAGMLTWGNDAPTNCTITFNQAYTGSPYCVVTWQANLASTTYVVTNTDITLTQTATSSNKTHYICFSRNGG